jgi:hypothetical protein
MVIYLFTMTSAKRFEVIVLIALIITAILIFVIWRNRGRPTPLPCGVRCGSERWNVKTLTDEMANCINFSPKHTTVSWLTAQRPPEHLPDERRISEIECQTWEVTARLVAFKAEQDDSDYHLVLQDLDADVTLIAEIPDSSCSGACNSPQSIQFEQARKTFTATFGTPSAKLVRLSHPVVITVNGVGFFDRKHRQVGLADNGIELHPVLALRVDAP